MDLDDAIFFAERYDTPIPGARIEGMGEGSKDQGENGTPTWRPDNPSEPDGNCQLYDGPFAIGGVAALGPKAFLGWIDGLECGCVTMAGARAWVEGRYRGLY